MGKGLGGVSLGSQSYSQWWGVAIQSLLEIAAVSAPMAGLFGATTGMILGSLFGYRHLTK